MSRQNQCSFCGVLGHNRRGCELALLCACLAPEVIDLTKNTCCSYCKVSGHNIRTCFGYNFKKSRAAKIIQSAWRRNCAENALNKQTGCVPIMKHNSIRKPRILPETKSVDSTPVERIPKKMYVSWMPGTVSPKPSIQRLHNQARTNSIALVAAHYDECGSPLVLP